MGQDELFNDGFIYKIPHGVYTPTSLVSTINTNILTTLNVSYLRGSTVSGGIKLNFNSIFKSSLVILDIIYINILLLNILLSIFMTF